MQILSIRRLAGTGGAFARFDVEIDENLRLFSLNLKRLADGRIRVFAPHAYGRHLASFAPDLARRITAVAVSALEAADGVH